MSFIAEAKAAEMIAAPEEFFEEAIFTTESDVLALLGYGRVLIAADTYHEGRSAILAHLRSRKIALDGIYGAKEIVLTGGKSMFVFIYEVAPA